MWKTSGTAGKNILMIWRRNASVFSYSSSLFKSWVCSLACFLISFVRCAMSWRMVLVCMVTSLIPCYLITCPVAMKRFSELPCKRDEYPSVTAEIFSMAHPLLIFLMSFLILLLVDLNDFWCCHTTIWCVFPIYNLIPLLWGLLNNTVWKIAVSLLVVSFQWVYFLWQGLSQLLKFWFCNCYLI